MKRAEPSHFGTIALVDGNLAKAKRELRRVDRVVSWTKHFLGDFPPGVRVEVYKQTLLMPLIQGIDHATDGIAGEGDFAFWQEADAVGDPLEARRSHPRSKRWPECGRTAPRCASYPCPTRRRSSSQLRTG